MKAIKYICNGSFSIGIGLSLAVIYKYQLEFGQLITIILFMMMCVFGLALTNLKDK